MLSFTAAVILLLITPGPGVLSIAGVGAAYGWRDGLRYAIGLFLGIVDFGFGELMDRILQP